MLKKIFIFYCLFLLSNCTTPTSAFLGPIFTGAKTGSVYQASLSYSGNRVINKFRQFEKKQSFNATAVEDFDKSTFTRSPIILAAYHIDKVEFSEIIDEEPLP